MKRVAKIVLITLVLGNVVAMSGCACDGGRMDKMSREYGGK